jgi:hypothetical protein
MLGRISRAFQPLQIVVGPILAPNPREMAERFRDNMIEWPCAVPNSWAGLGSFSTLDFSPDCGQQLRVLSPFWRCLSVTPIQSVRTQFGCVRLSLFGLRLRSFVLPLAAAPSILSLPISFWFPISPPWSALLNSLSPYEQHHPPALLFSLSIPPV